MNRLFPRIGWLVALTLGLWLLVMPTASAYIDPGSGSFVFQVLIGFALTAAVTVRTFWRRIREFLTARSARKG